MRLRGRRAVSKGMVAILGSALASLSLVAPPASGYPRPGSTEVVSVSSSEQQGAYCRPGDVPTQFCPAAPAAASPFASSLSANGRFVAFASAAGGLAPGDVNGHSDIFVRDRETGKTTIASVSSGGQIAVGHAGGGVDNFSVGPKYYGSHGGAWTMALSYDPSISADGRYVAFTSAAQNLVVGDTNGAVDVFVHDLKRGVTERVSVSSEGDEGTLDPSNTRPEVLVGYPQPDSFYPSISASGRYVSFSSFATNFTEQDTDGWADVFVHDRKTGRTTRVSERSGGGQAEMYTCESQAYDCRPWLPRSSMSSSARWVVFDSSAPDLVAGDTNRLADVFVHDRKTRKVERVSLGSNGEEGVDPSAQLGWAGAGSSLTGASPYYTAGHSISANGRYVTFVSRVDNLVPSDANRYPGLSGDWGAGQDVFVRDRKKDRTTRVSVSSVGRETEYLTKSKPILGNVHYQYPSISASGRFVAFEGIFEEGRSDAVFGTFVHDLQTGATEWVSRMTRVHDGETQPEAGSVADISSDGRYVSFASMGWPEEAHTKDKTDGMDYFVRDRGAAVGSGRSGSPSGKHEDGEEAEICIETVCLPPGSLVKQDPLSEAGTTKANLIGARIVHRPKHRDLFVVAEYDRLPRLAGSTAISGAAHLVHGLRFAMEGHRYEVRAAPGLGGRFGLFDCTTSIPGCRAVADLQGGFGTTGERIVFSLPRAALDLGRTARLRKVEVFTAAGNYATGPMRIVDSIRFDGGVGGAR